MGFFGCVVINKIRTSSTTMKFKEWIKKIEEAMTSKTGQRPSPGSSGPKPDMTSYRGIPYGWSGTQVPYSKSFDNPAVIGVPAGIGAGVDDDMKKMGREFSPTPRISEFPTEIEPSIQHGTLPLQLPTYLELDSDEYGRTTIVERRLFYKNQSFSGINFQTVSKKLKDGFMNSVRTLEDDPEEWNDISSVRNGQQGKFYKVTDETTQNDAERNPQTLDFNDQEVAKRFTRYIIQTIIIDNLIDQDKNIANKYNIMKPVIEYEAVKDDTLVCVFSFKPINKDMPDIRDIGGDE